MTIIDPVLKRGCEAAAKAWGYNSYMAAGPQTREKLKTEALSIINGILEAEPHHVVVTTEEDFRIEHPLSERLELGTLFDCDLNNYLSSLDGPPLIGKFKVSVRDDDFWDWEPYE